MSGKNRISLVPQHASALDLLWGGKSQLPQTPAAFDTPFFSRITIEQLIETLLFLPKSSKSHRFLKGTSTDIYKTAFWKILFTWPSMPIFSYIGYVLTELFRKPDNWRQIHKQTSLTFYTSNDVSKRKNSYSTSWQGYEIAVSLLFK